MPIRHKKVATYADEPGAEIQKFEWNDDHTSPDIADVTGLQAALDGKQPLATVLTNTTAAFTTAQETKLAGIEAGADVTDATNVAAAGAVMESDYSPSHSILVQQSGTGSPTALQVGNNTLVGRLSGGGSNIDDLTGTQATTLLDVFTTSLKGLAPSSGGGTTNFLRADGTWAAPSGGGGMAIGGSITSATAGSVLFAGTSGVLQQDNTNLFWDDTNNNLGIGTNTPNAAAAIDVVSTTKGIKLPVMTQTQRDAISSPPEGLMVYDSDFGGLWVRGKFSTWNNYRVTFNQANFVAPSSLELYEATGTGTSKVTLTVPSAMGADYTATLPEATGTLALDNVFTSGAKGLAPASGGGSTNFLRADGTWAAPSGGGGATTLTTVEKNLGSNPRRSGRFTITGLSGLTIGKPVSISQAVAPYTNKGTRADEAEMDGLIVNAVVTAVDTITAYWNSATRVRGNFKFNYFVGA
jgi:hypothetical protein